MHLDLPMTSIDIQNVCKKSTTFASTLPIPSTTVSRTDKYKCSVLVCIHIIISPTNQPYSAIKFKSDHARWLGEEGAWYT